MKMSEQWILDNWEGVMIKTEDFFGSHWVPGWKCKHCGGQIGSLRGPPKKCFHCGYQSSEGSAK